MANNFGKTWWGEAWLRSLTHIDYENRIPRGARYARNGYGSSRRVSSQNCAYRIGQKKNVMVHRFITRNTFEERINDMINNKRALAEMTVSTGESWIGKLRNKELRELFG